MEGLKDLILGWAGNLFLGIVGAAALIFLVKREFVRFLEFAILAILIGVFIYQPDVIKGIADVVGRAMGQ